MASGNRLFRAAGALAIGVALIACTRAGQGRTATTAPATPSPDATSSAFPPSDVDELAAIFDPLLEPYGLTTTRANLLETTAPYEPSPTGRFLGLYVEPTGPYASSDYIQNIVPTARVVIVAAFERWPGIAIVDLCQEPPPGVNDEEAPPPETQVQISRDASAGLDWSELELADLIAEADDNDSDPFVVRVSARLADDPIWQEAVEAAETQNTE